MVGDPWGRHSDSVVTPELIREAASQSARGCFRNSARRAFFCARLERIWLESRSQAEQSCRLSAVASSAVDSISDQIPHEETAISRNLQAYFFVSTSDGSCISPKIKEVPDER